MSGLLVAQIIIDDSSDKTISGAWVFDSANGGAIAIPAGSTFPTDTHPGDIFWNTTNNTIYRRNDSNTAWVAETSPISGAAGGDLDGTYPNPNVVNLHITGQTLGSFIYYDGTKWSPLAVGSDGYFLQSKGGIPVWSDHDTLRKLIHLADGGGPFEGFTSGAYKEITPTAAPFPTSVIWWTDHFKTSKIVEKTISYNSNKTPSTIVWKAYDIDGFTVLATVEDIINYSGVFETNRTRTIS